MTVRLNPPPLPPGAELAWVLRRAFGAAASAVEPPRNPGGALHTARKLDLAARIGARHARSQLATEVGPACAEALFLAAASTTARNLTMLGTVEEVSGILEEAGLGPVIALKGAALLSGGMTLPEARALADVDLLVPVATVQDAFVSLKERGYATPDLEEREHHHLLPLRGDNGVDVELHSRIPGVRLEGKGEDATAEELLDRRLCHQVMDLGGVFVPNRDVLVAHELAHGLDQHLFDATYPLSRLIADLVDLGAAENGVGASARGMTGAAVDPWLVDAAEELVRTLVAGCAEPGAGSGADRLLRHIVGLALDQDYARAMRLRGRVRQAGQHRGARWWWSSIVLSRTQVDMIYGQPRHSWGYAVRQAWRPFDLAGRIGGYALAAARQKLRMRRES